MLILLANLAGFPQFSDNRTDIFHQNPYLPATSPDLTAIQSETWNLEDHQDHPTNPNW
jgi:hypothetical protein